MNFAFRVHITKSIGLGHLKRLNILKKYIKQNVYWIVSGDKEIIYKNIRKSKNILFIKSIKHEAKIANELFAKGLNKVVFDIANNKFLKKNLNLKIISIYKKFGHKIISYDLPNQKNLSDISIIPYDLEKRKEIKKNCINFYGSKYYLNDNLRMNKNKNKIKIKKILITIGGSDFKNIGYELAKILKNENFKIKLLCGLNNIKSNLSNVETIGLVQNIDKYLKWSDIVICGEGLTKYEIIYQNKPFIMIHQFDTRSNMIKSFIKEDYCLSLGLYSKKNLKNYKRKILEYINNNDLISKHLKKQIKIFDNINVYKNKRKLINLIRK
tara:strand:+ start:5873 stop:6847 length:975 start_codon:yes stop_codon:yes gene_type:complete